MSAWALVVPFQSRPQIISDADGMSRSVHVAADDVRSHENRELRAIAVARLPLEEIPQDRNVLEKRNAAVGSLR